MLHLSSCNKIFLFNIYKQEYTKQTYIHISIFTQSKCKLSLHDVLIFTAMFNIL